MLTSLDGLLWLLILVGPLLVLQRSLHRQMQAVLLLITRRVEIALALFSLLFFPGVLLHEASHYIVAALLGVRVGRFSLIPKVVASREPRSGFRGPARLQLGYVETTPTDIFRDALIGAAPFVFGGLFVTYAGLARLNLDTLWLSLMNGGPQAWLAGFDVLFTRPDFWLWFYLTFVVSSTMLPSASDRRAWLPLSMILGLLFVISLLVGAGPWLYVHVAPVFNQALRALAVVMGISAVLHLLLLVPVVLLRQFLSRVTGLKVV